MTAFREWNLDALVGPSHHFAGLSLGNQASMNNKATPSHPKKAALNSLEKMKMLFDMGIPQLIIPPQHRPRIDCLYNAGFKGSEEKILQDALRKLRGDDIE